MGEGCGDGFGLGTGGFEGAGLGAGGAAGLGEPDTCINAIVSLFFDDSNRQVCSNVSKSKNEHAVFRRHMAQQALGESSVVDAIIVPPN